MKAPAPTCDAVAVRTGETPRYQRCDATAVYVVTFKGIQFPFYVCEAHKNSPATMKLAKEIARIELKKKKDG